MASLADDPIVSLVEEWVEIHSRLDRLPDGAFYAVPPHPDFARCEEIERQVSLMTPTTVLGLCAKVALPRAFDE